MCWSFLKPECRAMLITVQTRSLDVVSKGYLIQVKAANLFFGRFYWATVKWCGGTSLEFNATHTDEWKISHQVLLYLEPIP
jgi:hypothetical protein